MKLKIVREIASMWMCMCAYKWGEENLEILLVKLCIYGKTKTYSSIYTHYVKQVWKDSFKILDSSGD